MVTQGTAAGAFGGFPLNQVCVAGKTGTAQIMGKVATSVFASFAPCNNPKLVVVVMLPNSGYGADAAAPAVRQIWDGIFGLEGKKAAMPGGNLPGLPPDRDLVRPADGPRPGKGDAPGHAREEAASERRAPVPRLGGPRAGTFAPRRRSALARRSPRAASPGPGTGR